MNCIDYYKQLDVDITLLPLNERNSIASLFLENMVFSKEELEEILRDNLEKKE